MRVTHRPTVALSMNNGRPDRNWAAEQETKVKKIIALATAVVALAIPATALADSSGNQASP
jgi:hypothetical protein